MMNHTEATKQKIRQKTTAWYKKQKELGIVIHRDLHGENNPMFGKKHSEETKKKIGEKSKGRVVFTEDKLKEIKLKRSGNGNPFYGKHHTEETRKLLSLKHTGKVVSEETRKKQSAIRKGRRQPEEMKRKLSEMRKGQNNPCWRGGHAHDPYCPKFNNEFKERVRAFFDYTCQKCGHRWVPTEKRLSVHHVNYQKTACCDQDVIPLFVSICSGSCHMATNHNREFWESHYTEIINTRYNGKSYFTKEEMGEYLVNKRIV